MCVSVLCVCVCVCVNHQQWYIGVNFLFKRNALYFFFTFYGGRYKSYPLLPLELPSSCSCTLSNRKGQSGFKWRIKYYCVMFQTMTTVECSKMHTKIPLGNKVMFCRICKRIIINLSMQIVNIIFKKIAILDITVFLIGIIFFILLWTTVIRFNGPSSMILLMRTWHMHKKLSLINDQVLQRFRNRHKFIPSGF